MSRTTPGWYIDPKNPKRDIYWTGHMWSGAQRPNEATTPVFPEDGEGRTDGERRSAARPSTARDEWTFRANVMYAVAALSAIGALIGGIVVAAIKGQSCTTNYYDASSPNCGDTHPYVWAGIGIIVAGLVQALAISYIGRLCAAQAEQASAPAVDK